MTRLGKISDVLSRFCHGKIGIDRCYHPDTKELGGIHAMTFVSRKHIQTSRGRTGRIRYAVRCALCKDTFRFQLALDMAAQLDVMLEQEKTSR